MVVTAPEILKVAVIDDDRSDASAMGEIVRDAGYRPVILPAPNHPLADVGDLVQMVRNQADAAICDHRLRPRNFALFDGAEAVARLVASSIPAILVTQYVDSDADVSIRRWRDRIPVLLSRDGADVDGIRQGLGTCAREIKGELSSVRRAWRTLIQIRDVIDDAGEQVIDAYVLPWNPHEVVRFPASLVPPDLRGHLSADHFLFAMVNIGAEKAEDLFFRDFEAAPDPIEEEALG